MNRLRILKNRFTKAGVGVARLKDGWYVANKNCCSGPYSKREAYYEASRWALPSVEMSIFIN